MVGPRSPIRLIGGSWSRPTGRPDAASWLLSTVDDLWAFAQMLRAGGAYRGGRVLSEESVAAMITDRVSPAERAGSEDLLEEHESWGYGMLVPAAGDPESLGEYGWDGGSGTSWRTHPDAGVHRDPAHPARARRAAGNGDLRRLLGRATRPFDKLRTRPREGGSAIEDSGDGGLDR